MALLYEKESKSIIGACIEVQKELGIGFLEPVYQDALEIEFKLRGIPFEREKWIDIFYHGEAIKHRYKVDFLCYSKIVVELKAVSCLTDAHVAQTLNYMKATHIQLGLLINFNQAPLQPRRIIRTM